MGETERVGEIERVPQRFLTSLIHVHCLFVRCVALTNITRRFQIFHINKYDDDEDEDDDDKKKRQQPHKRTS